MADKGIRSIIFGGVGRIIIALTAVGVFSGISLVFVYNYATPRIKVNVKNETERAIKALFPEVSSIEQDSDKGLYNVRGAGGGLLGYAFIAEGNGYQGTIKLLVGTDTDISRTMGIEVLESSETPGLGAEISGEKFKGQFRGLSIKHAIEYVKNEKPDQPYEIEAITGATISSRAVVNIINSRVDQVRKDLGKVN